VASMKRTKREMLGVVVLLAIAGSVLAQDTAASGKALTYDVVSIKPHDPSESNTRLQMNPGGYIATNAWVRMLIQNAYDLKMPDQILGLPSAMGDARFNVEAKMDGETAAALKAMNNDERAAQRRLMMQALLADRFHLKVHHESRVMPLYELVVAKNGFKLKEADPNNTYASGFKGPNGSGAGMTSFRMSGKASTVTMQGTELSALTNILSQQLHRQVVDKTGLKGKYDMTLEWTPEDALAQSTAVDDAKPGIFTALQEQLGLKLESTKGPVDVIVIDGIEMPAAN
jgi:uncharacterized protein (TIGR03435 family)